MLKIMIIKTRIFELRNGNYRNLSELAQVMELSVSQVYRVREGKRSINQKFIVGAKKAFPDYRLDELFYLDGEPGHVDMGGDSCHRAISPHRSTIFWLEFSGI